MAKVVFNKNRFFLAVNLSVRNQLFKCYIWSIAFYGAVTWTVRKVDQKHL